MTANTGEVHLRDVEDADLPIFFELQRDPAYNHMVAFTYRDPADNEAFLSHWRKLRGDGTVVIRTILLDGQVVGNVASWVQSGERQVAYVVAREHWGKGVATRALAAFLGHVRERPLFAWAAHDNRGSLRVLEKCGFIVHGAGRGFANARGEEIEEIMLRLD